MTGQTMLSVILGDLKASLIPFLGDFPQFRIFLPQHIPRLGGLLDAVEAPKAIEFDVKWIDHIDRVKILEGVLFGPAPLNQGGI